MGTLAVDTKVTRRTKPGDIVVPLVASAAFYKGAVLVFDASGAAGTVKGHATETTKFAGIALEAAAAAGDTVSVLQLGDIETPLAVQVDEGDEGTVIYCPANSTNPADSNKTSSSNLAIGSLTLLLTEGASGSNVSCVRIKAAGY